MSPSQTNLGGLYAIYGIVGVSLVVLTGWGGQISLGQFASLASPTPTPVAGAPGLFQASANQLASTPLPSNAPAALVAAVAALSLVT